MTESQKLEILFQTLADGNRLKILRSIGRNACSVSEIVSATGLSQPLVSHHLKTLRERSILETKREGPFVFYSLKDVRLLDVLGVFSEISGGIADAGDDRRMFLCPKWYKR
jgi:DNA-binding transcriptional ArsR family regulator